MAALEATVDRRDPELAANRAAMLELLAQLDDAQAQACMGGGSYYVERHRSRGRMLPRERIELLVDRDSPFLELSPIAAWGTEYPVGASVVTGIGLVELRPCMVIAHDPTVRGGGVHKPSLDKQMRALQIARENALPVVFLVESAGGDLSRQSDTFTTGGAIFRELTRLSAEGVTTIALVFGNATAGGAYIPGTCDYVVMIDQQAHVFLGGPPLVKMATGEEADAEELGGALMHTSTSGVADYLAVDEQDCLRIGRDIMSRLKGVPPVCAAQRDAPPPRYGTDELLELASVDVRRGIRARPVIARIVDDSDFDEFKPRYGPNLITGFARIHGHPVGILVNDRGVLFSPEANKAAQFIQLANQTRTPLIFLQNTTGFMVGAEYERRGIVKDGAKMINAVANSTVPHITMIIGSAYGAGNYAMCGRSYEPRMIFSWPNARSSVMGPEQLAGVLSIITRQAAERSGKPFDEVADAAQRAQVQEQIESESRAFYNTGCLRDDGVIDPRDSRTVLGLALAVCALAPQQPAANFGVFRM